MGNANSGRKGTSENSAEVKQRLAEIAKDGVKYLAEVSQGKHKRPSVVRTNVIMEAINHTIGKPRQQVDSTISGQLTLIDQLRSLTDEQLAALLALVEKPKEP